MVSQRPGGSAGGRVRRHPCSGKIRDCCQRVSVPPTYLSLPGRRAGPPAGSPRPCRGRLQRGDGLGELVKSSFQLFPAGLGHGSDLVPERLKPPFQEFQGLVQ